MQNIIHIPVISMKASDTIQYNGKNVDWYSTNPIFEYPYVLMSAYYGLMVNDARNTRRDMKTRDDVTFFGDSGGYQLLQFMEGNINDPHIPEKLTPKRVIDWQLNNCNIGMTLDLPTPREGYNRTTFEKHLNISQENAKYAYMVKSNDPRGEKFKLFNCIHGLTLKDMEEWKKTTDKDCEFDGYSMSVRGGILPLRLGFAMEHSTEKPFHLLGLGNTRDVILVAYANRYTKTQIYFDSASAAKSKIDHAWWNPWQMVPIRPILLAEDQTPLPCNCPVCSHVVNFADYRNVTYGRLLAMHNLHVFLQYVEFMDALSRRSDFKDYIKTIDKDGSLLRDISFLDAVHEEGLDKAYAKFYSKTDTMDNWW